MTRTGKSSNQIYVLRIFIIIIVLTTLNILKFSFIKIRFVLYRTRGTFNLHCLLLLYYYILLKTKKFSFR